MTANRKPKQPPEFDPKARVAVQTEADPKDKALVALEVRELRGLKKAVESIDGTLKLMLAVLQQIATPPKAQNLNPTVSEIPKT